MIFFSSDHHFNHERIIEFSKRPFANLEEMTETMIANWNSVVNKGDTVYHLGDFALSWGKKHEAVIDSILSRLNGQKILIKGNHDRKEVFNNKRWQAVHQALEIKPKMPWGTQKIYIHHYSQRTWPSAQRGAWMLYGHSHGNLSDIGGKTIDVGVDCHNYTPISIEQVKEIMDQREILVVDHHELEEEDESN